MYDNELWRLASRCRPRVVGEYSIPKFLKAKEYVPQRAVVSEELDLARAVEYHVLICDSISMSIASV